MSKKRFGGYPFLTFVFSNYLSLLITSMFIVIFLHTDKFTTMLKENIRLQIYLNKNVKNNTITNIKDWLIKQNFVLSKDKEYKIKFISKEAAADQFIKETGEDFRKVLKENPLRHSYVININPYYSDKLENVKKSIELQEGVFEVCYIKTIIYSVNKNIKNITKVLLILSIAMVIIVFSLINNTVKIAIYSQRLLIRSMQLVGATNNFIRAPFLKRAVYISITSSIMAIASMVYGIKYFNEVFNLIEINNYEICLLSVYIITSSLIINLFSTYVSTTKYLNTDLDKLY